MIRAALIVLRCVPAIAADPSAPAENAATPLDAARQYFIALRGSDRQALRSSVSGKTEQENRAADVWADSTSGQGRVSSLIQMRFGTQGFQAFYGRPMQPSISDEEFSHRADQVFAEAKIEVVGNEARITPKGAAPTEAVWLIRRNGSWKVWIVAVLRARDAELLDNYVRYNRHLGPTYHRTADAIESGALLNVQAAIQAHGQFEDEELTKLEGGVRPPVQTPEQIITNQQKVNQQLLDLERRRAALEREAANRPLGQREP